MSRNKKYGVIVHQEDFEDFLTNMTDQEAGAMLKNMLHTFLGEEVKTFGERYMDSISKRLCDRVIYDKGLSEKNAKNGALGGGQMGNTNAKRAKTSENDPKTSEKRAKTNLNIKVKDNINIKDNKDNKKPYGECANVFLTDEEFEKVKNQGLTNLIEELSLYIASKGNKYKSHYAVIKQWANRREKEKEIKKPSSLAGQSSTNIVNRFKQRDDYDFAAIEAKLIKN